MRQPSFLYFIARLTLASCLISQLGFASAQQRPPTGPKQPLKVPGRQLPESPSSAGQRQTTESPPATQGQPSKSPTGQAQPAQSTPTAQGQPAKSDGQPAHQAPTGQTESNAGPGSGTATLTLSASTNIAQPNQPVHFTLSWNREVVRVAYVFDWGDNSAPENETVPTADHAYSSPGNYTVRATAHSVVKPASAGDPTSNAVTIQIPSPQTTTAALSADKPNIHPGDSVTFTATASPSASDAQYTYNFGDGSAAQPGSDHAAHTYNGQGTFPATVTILTRDGQQSAVSPTVEIRVAAVALPPPTVDVASAKTEYVVGDSVLVTATLNPPQKTLGFEFNWNDGSLPEKVSSRGTAEHSYSQSGPYQVVVTAETAKTYDPPLTGSVQLNVGESPQTIWLKGAMAAVAALLLGLIGWAIHHMRRRPKLSYAPHPGLVRSEISFRRDSQPSSSNPFKLTPGMDQEEHTLKFRR